jgi:hypothetical protein
MECDHVNKIVKFGYELLDGQMHSTVELFGCTKCDVTSTEPLYDLNEVFEPKSHGNCKYDPCFGCKAKTLQLNAGDATRDIPDKKWTSELNEYKAARAEGIQPAGTTRAHIEQARTASETLGKAYNADSMPKAKDITKESVAVMKEIGQI